MNETHEMLFQRIREKCHLRRWHGADVYDPHETIRRMRESEQQESNQQYSFRSNSTLFWYDKDGKQYAINKYTNLSNFPLQTDFENSVATQEELDSAEQSLGFPLPALLKELYANVANGGFGPGYGLTSLESIAGGYSTMKQSNRLVDIAFYERRQGSADHLEIPNYVWPDRFLCLCHWGCAIFSHLDCITERIFRGGALLDSYGLDLEAASLYDWLDLWVRDELRF
jgi:hypothetical protein